MTVWLALSNSRDLLIKVNFGEVVLMVLCCIILVCFHISVNAIILFLQYKYMPEKYKIQVPSIKCIKYNIYSSNNLLIIIEISILIFQNKLKNFVFHYSLLICTQMLIINEEYLKKTILLRLIKISVGHLFRRI